MGKSMPIAEFYSRISAGAMPVTSQVNTEAYTEMFESYLSQGIDVLHISLSSGISGSYSSAAAAQKELAPRYPDRKLYVIDSLAASSGYGLLLDKSLDMRDAGATIDEVHEWVEDNKLRLHHWFFTSDLTHLRRGGRVSSASAIVGTFLNICPILNVDYHGNLTPRSKVRGKKRVIAEMVERMKSHAEGGLSYSGKCFMSQSACYEDAKALSDAILAEFKNIDGGVVINNIGTVIGSHTGPGTVALFFWGDKRVD
jgi:DegV family protein with EDD domain